ncbi:MAG: hypothetical protein ACOZCL_15410 [Bacillota bacterium]
MAWYGHGAITHRGNWETVPTLLKIYLNVPVHVSITPKIAAVSGGVIHSLALEREGTVWAWGDSGQGQLGYGSDASSNVPVKVLNIENIDRIAAGGFHNLAL